MNNLYDTLRIESDKCPSGCALCQEACAQEKGESDVHMSRITAVAPLETGYHSVITCVQCSEPLCQEACPAGAIEKNLVSGVVELDRDRCVGCGLCTLACLYGGIQHNPDISKSAKCDMCGGEPKCVPACPHNVLSHVENSGIVKSFETEDVLSRGTSACAGCPAEVALRLTLRMVGRNSIMFGAPGCLTHIIVGMQDQVGTELAASACLLDNVASLMTGVSRYYRHIGREVNLVAFVGDGATADIGFQALSGAVERKENFTYICYDNEGYMNTGNQRSGTTPYGARTTTSPVGKMAHGKEQPSKNVPLLLAFNGASYVATANIAFLEDYMQKLVKALQVRDGVAYVHLYSPCPTGWGVSQDGALNVARAAVETNFFPLWEADHGKIQLTHKVAKPKPILELTRLMGKFSHLSKQELQQLQQFTDANFALIERLGQLWK